MARARAQKAEQPAAAPKAPRSLSASIDAVLRRIQTVQERGRKDHPLASEGVRMAMDEADRKINAGVEALRELAGAVDDMSTLCTLVERQQKRLTSDTTEASSGTSETETRDPAESVPSPLASVATEPQTPQTAQQHSAG